MADTAIHISSLSKTFGKGRKKKSAVDNLNLKVKCGEVFGFLGPNGAGKSTTIKLLLNFLKPDSGELQVLGRVVGQHEFRHKIGYLSELPFFYNHLTAKETLLLSGRLSGMSKVQISPRINLLLDRMDLIDASDRRIGGF